MYAGSTLKAMKYFDAWFGAHQKIDRIAHKHLTWVCTGNCAKFPSFGKINKFEGINGPDGIKRKRPSADEPWHFYDPTDPTDTKLAKIIDGHYDKLVDALRRQDETRAAFEAAWLAHAIVDGLTPAHQYPYEAELAKLRSGQGIETRDSVREKLLMHGDTFSQQVHNNWKMWGDKGLLATHFAFEWGIAVMILPLRLRIARPLPAEITAARTMKAGDFFRSRAQQVATWQLYEQFYKSGWTPKLAKRTRRLLVPLIINTVTLVWHRAAEEAAEQVKAKA